MYDDSLKFFQNTLLQWYEKYGRSFPWRKETDPYRILVAEVMLQRTKAYQVASVYPEFVRKFPNLHSLANASLDDVLLHTRKLGLSKRGNLLILIAKEIESLFNSSIPDDVEKLMGLLGIGNYISTALSVFAFNKIHVVVDTNVIRLVSRYFKVNMKGEARRNSIFIKFCQTLSCCITEESIKEFNWALLDFPSLVCKIKPDCWKCPLSSNCLYPDKIMDTN